MDAQREVNGCLRLVFRRRADGNTCLAEQYYKLPLQVIMGHYQDHDATPVVYALNPTGGVLQGDHFRWRVNVEARAAAVISTPSATKYYRMEDDGASQTADFFVDAGGVLEYIPEYAIPFAGSSFVQENTFHLAADASLFCWDIFTAGRLACGERFSFRQYCSQIAIYRAEELLLLERMHLDPKQKKVCGEGLMGDYAVLATVYICAPKTDCDLLRAIADCLARHGDIHGGCSQPATGLIVVKLLANRSWDAQEALWAIWDTVRPFILSKPAFRLRK